MVSFIAVSDKLNLALSMGFPGGSAGKEFFLQCRCERCSFSPWVGHIPLEEKMAIHFSILAGKIPYAEEPGRLQSTALQRVGHD